MATKRGFLGWRAFSASEESAFGTAQTINNTENAIGGDFLSMGEELTSNTDTLLGYEEETEQHELSRNAEVSHRQRLTPNGLALFASFCLGNSSTEDDGGGYFTHTISPRPKTMVNVTSASGTNWPIVVDDTRDFPSAGTLVYEPDGSEFVYTSKTPTQFGGSVTHNTITANKPLSLKSNLDSFDLPSLTVLEMLNHDSTNRYRYTGCIIGKIVVELARKQWGTIEAQIISRGVRTTQTTARPSLEGETPFKAGDATVITGGSWDGVAYTGSTDIDATLRSLTWEFDNVPEGDDAYLFNEGLLRGRAERTRRKQSVTAQLELDSSTWLDYLTAGSNIALRVALTGTGSYAAQLVFPRLRVAEIGLGGGMLTLTQDASMETFEQDAYSSVHLDVTNQVAGYLS